jgi:chromate reductase
MKVVAIVGSIRKDSYNLKLAQFIQKRYQEQFDLEILNIHESPFYDQVIEMDPRAVVKDFKSKVADAVLWVTPEYNATVPGVLVNVIDWLSRVEKVMNGEPSWIVGTSMGNLGTVKAQLHLHEILFAMRLSSSLLPGNEVYVGAVHEKFNEAGELTHEPTVQFSNTVVDNFINWMNHQNR